MLLCRGLDIHAKEVLAPRLFELFVEGVGKLGGVYGFYHREVWDPCEHLSKWMPHTVQDPCDEEPGRAGWGHLALIGLHLSYEVPLDVRR